MRLLLTLQLLAAAIIGPVMATAATDGDDSRYLDTSMPERWTYDEHFNQLIPDEDHWWSYFNDPLLDSLIARGVANNYNIAMAEHRINIARQAINSARASYYPTVNFSGGWQKSRTSGGNGPVMGDASTGDFFSLGLSASWEVDIFGRIRDKVKSQKAGYRASRAEYAAAMTTMCANIAKSYISLRMYQAEWEVAREHIESQSKIVKITEARHEAGLSSMLDVTQARTVFYSTQASIPGLENAIHTTINSLATLLGEYPDELYKTLSAVGPLPDHQQIVPIGVPAELLRRRPDIVEAECDLAQYAAALGIAKKDFLPSLSINGSVGTSAHKAGDLFKNQTLTYSIAPTLSWTLFDGMARRSGLITAREQMKAGIENYNLTVMSAVQEVDNSISTYVSTLRKIDVMEEVVDNSRKSLDLSLDLYKKGLNPFTDVVNAQLNTLSYQNSLIEAKGQALASLISLYEALGGGWDVSKID